MKSFARDLPQRIETDFVNVLNLLRDPEFQDLLVNYPRPKRGFIVTYETEDEVSSEWLLRQHDGTLWKPEDYLVAFSRYVKENPEHIEAIDFDTLPIFQREGGWNEERMGTMAGDFRGEAINVVTAEDIEGGEE
jgi:type I restriction enzyme R subunit